MNKVVVNKCEICGKLFEDDQKYNEHMRIHELLKKLEERFPRMNLGFGQFIHRDEGWFESYKSAVLEIIGDIGFPPFTGIWYRCLDDSRNPFCSIAFRVLNVCKKCFNEWDQPANANRCSHY